MKTFTNYSNREKNDHLNEKMITEFKSQCDRLLTSMMAEIAATQGFELSELDPEMIRLYNKYIRMYNEIFNTALGFAREQDEIDLGRRMRLARMEEKEDEILELLERQHRTNQIMIGMEKKISDKLGVKDTPKEEEES